MQGHKGPQPHKLITASRHLNLLCMATKALSHTGWLQHNGTFICYGWPQRPSATQTNYSIMALLFVMHGHKGPQQHRLITASRHYYLVWMATKALRRTGRLQHKGTFNRYGWPQRPSATQTNYSITPLLFVMYGHKGPHPHRLITA